MLTRSIELDGVATEPDRDVDVLSVYTASASLAVAAGAFGTLMAAIEDLSARQRLLGAAGALATSAFGLAALSRPVELASLLRQRLLPSALPFLGLAGIAASGSTRSPMFYPGLILTGFGGGRLGRPPADLREPGASSVLGAAVACCYLANAALAHRRKPAGGNGGLRWNAGAAPLFFAAATVGGELGDVALAARRVERARARDRCTLHAAGERGRGALRDVAAQVGETATELEQTLLRIATYHRSQQRPSARDVQTAVQTVRSDIQHHLLGPLLVAAANDEPLELARTLDAILDVYRDGWREQSVAIELDSRLPAGLKLDARATSVLVRATKVALDNAYRHQRHRLSAIELELRLSDGRVRLTVGDDGGAEHAPQPEDWGTGLTETLAHVRSVGGELALNPGPCGLRLRVDVPASASAASIAEPPVSLDGRIEASLSRCARVLRPAAWLNGLSCCLSARSRRAQAASALLFSSLVAVDRIWNRRDPRDRRRAAAILPAVSLLWPVGGLPPTGWGGLELIAQGARGESEQVLALGALTSAGTAVAAWRARRGLARARIVENLAFPVVCTASGIAAAYGRRLLRRAERESLGLRERAELIERLGRAVRLYHELIKPLRNSPAWYDEEIVESADGQRLLELSGRIDELTQQLLALIAEADPIRELHEQLQLRLQPTVVTVAGVRPVWTSERSREAGVERAREHLAVVALADELADWLLSCYPPKLDGSARLRRLRIELEPLDERDMCISLRTDPACGRRDGDPSALQAALARIAGRIQEGVQPAVLAFTLPATALAGT